MLKTWKYTKFPFFVINIEMVFLYYTVTPPLYAEEWHVRPPAYDIYDSYPESNDDYESEDTKDPRDYPYAQYTNRINLLPRQAEKIRLFCNEKAKSQEYVNNLFTMDTIAFRENMTRILKKKLHQRYRHDCYDLFSPYLQNFSEQL
jgi:hypothetical protein